MLGLIGDKVTEYIKGGNCCSSEGSGNVSGTINNSFSFSATAEASFFKATANLENTNNCTNCISIGGQHYHNQSEAEPTYNLTQYAIKRLEGISRFDPNTKVTDLAFLYQELNSGIEGFLIEKNKEFVELLKAVDFSKPEQGLGYTAAIHGNISEQERVLLTEVCMMLFITIMHMYVAVPTRANQPFSNQYADGTNINPDGTPYTVLVQGSPGLIPFDSLFRSMMFAALMITTPMQAHSILQCLKGNPTEIPDRNYQYKPNILTSQVALTYQKYLPFATQFYNGTKLDVKKMIRDQVVVLVPETLSTDEYGNQVIDYQLPDGFSLKRPCCSPICFRRTHEFNARTGFLRVLPRDVQEGMFYFDPDYFEESDQPNFNRPHFEHKKKVDKTDLTNRIGAPQKEDISRARVHQTNTRKRNQVVPYDSDLEEIREDIELETPISRSTQPKTLSPKSPEKVRSSRSTNTLTSKAQVHRSNSEESRPRRGSNESIPYMDETPKIQTRIGQKSQTKVLRDSSNSNKSNSSTNSSVPLLDLASNPSVENMKTSTV